MKVEEVKRGSHIWEIRDAVDRDLCAAIIDYFEEHCRRFPGRVGEGVVVPEVKNSTDGILPSKSLFDHMLLEAFNEAVELFREHIPGLRWVTDGLSIDIGGFQIQSYDPNEGHYLWHVDSQDLESSKRVLALILYLNDVGEGGETEFKHQETKIKPEAGKLACFPPYWTHEHRGVPASERKYILTTFITFRHGEKTHKDVYPPEVEKIIKEGR